MPEPREGPAESEGRAAPGARLPGRETPERPRESLPPSLPIRPSAILVDAVAETVSHNLWRFAWLILLVFPLSRYLSGHRDVFQVALGVVGGAVIVGFFVWVGRSARGTRKGAGSLLGPILLVIVAVALNLVDGPEYTFTYFFAAVAAGRLLPARRAMYSAVTIAALAAAVTAGAGGLRGSPDPGGAASLAFGIFLVAAITASVTALSVNNAELRAARDEVARLAVAEERGRIARDVHDLLGHSLSLIALKSELAGRLVTVDSQRAAEEIRDVEAVARDALREVREAVSGYRHVSLAAELAAARVLLGAAGIDCSVEHGLSYVSEDADATLGSAVREGVTNVIRHSGAEHCTIRTFGRRGEAGIEILDDGRGPQPAEPSASGGHGLAGLGERVAAARGRIEAGRGPDGGFRLRVTVPAPGEPAGRQDAGAGPVGRGEPARRDSEQRVSEPRVSEPREPGRRQSEPRASELPESERRGTAA